MEKKELREEQLNMEQSLDNNITSNKEDNVMENNMETNNEMNVEVTNTPAPAPEMVAAPKRKSNLGIIVALVAVIVLALGTTVIAVVCAKKTPKEDPQEVAVVEPSEAPEATVEPSEAPEATVEPSEEPGATVEPSEEPGATVEPSEESVGEIEMIPWETFAKQEGGEDICVVVWNDKTSTQEVIELTFLLTDDTEPEDIEYYEVHLGDRVAVPYREDIEFIIDAKGNLIEATNGYYEYEITETGFYGYNVVLYGSDSALLFAFHVVAE